MLYSYISLACYKLVCFWWLCMFSFLSFFCLWEGAGISSKKAPKVRKDFIHTGRQTKNATEDESSLQTHACKLVFTNTRQQATMSDNRKTKTQVKNTDEYRSKNRWMEIDIEQRGALEEANQNKTDAKTFLQQTQDQSQRRLILSYVFFQILQGPVGDALARAMPYEMLVPRCEGICSV